MMKEEKDQSTYYDVCLYTPVSFVLFLIALTFPTDPTIENIAIANLWITILFDILPIRDVPFGKYLDVLHFHAEHEPLKTREAFFFFVFHLHELVLGEKLNKYETLQFFEELRANECLKTQTNVKPNEPKKEASCVRKIEKTPFACAIMVSDELRSKQSFIMDDEVRSNSIASDEVVIWKQAMENPNAFCSCVFSAKWFLLHMVAFAYSKNPSESDKYKHHTFLTLFGKILACFACRVNFQSNLELVQYSPQVNLKSQQTFFEFVYRLHDIVNQMLGKKAHVVSFEETTDFFQLLANQVSNAQSRFFCNVLIAKQNVACARYYFIQQDKTQTA